MDLPYIDLPNHFLSVNPIVVKKFAGLSAEHYTMYVKTHFQNQARNSPGVKSSPPPQPSPSEGGGKGGGEFFRLFFATFRSTIGMNLEEYKIMLVHPFQSQESI